MALNCTDCKLKMKEGSGVHCQVFHLKPIQIDECKLHSKFDKPREVKPISNDRPGYIWLNQSREAEQINRS